MKMDDEPDDEPQPPTQSEWDWAMNDYPDGA